MNRIITTTLLACFLLAGATIIKAQTPLGPPTVSNQDIFNMSTQHGYSDVGINESGQYAVMWTRNPTNMLNTHGIYLRMFNADGTPACNEVQVDGVVSLNLPKVHIDNAGNAYVYYDRKNSFDGIDYTLFVKKYSMAGALLATTNVGPADQSCQGDIGVSGDGKFVVCHSTASPGNNIFLKLYDTNGNLLKSLNTGYTGYNSYIDVMGNKILLGHVTGSNHYLTKYEYVLSGVWNINALTTNVNVGAGGFPLYDPVALKGNGEAAYLRINSGALYMETRYSNDLSLKSSTPIPSVTAAIDAGLSNKTVIIYKQDNGGGNYSINGRLYNQNDVLEGSFTNVMSTSYPNGVNMYDCKFVTTGDSMHSNSAWDVETHVYHRRYTCENCSNCSLSLNRVTSCGPGQICFNYTLPQAGSGTPYLAITLKIYQNGVLLQTLPGPSLISGNLYCFNINPAAIPGINDNLAGFDFVATGNFGISGLPMQTVTLGTAPNGQTTGQNNDYSIYCVNQCCRGRNEIRNPGFESGNLYFSTAYNYQSIILPGSVGPGKYAVITSAEGLTVSPTWNVNCAVNGHHLYINGATGGTGNKIAWYQNVTVERGKTYKFCADMKNLPQCGFDVKPRVDVEFGVPGFNLDDILINVPPGSCNWQTVSQEITIPGSGGSLAMNIRILLDETPNGDGNDLAIDNITLVEIQPVPAAELLFDVDFFNVSGNTFNMAATPVAGLGKGCGFYWEVEEIDNDNQIVAGTAVYNPAQWWPLNPNTFTGYNGTSTLVGNNPGVFQLDRRYRIVYGRWCECGSWNAYAVIIDPLKSAGLAENILVVKDDKYQLSPAQAATIISGQPPKSSKTITPAAEEPAPAGKASLTVFPNPAGNILRAGFTPCGTNCKLVIYNMYGGLVQEIALRTNAGRADIDVSKLAPGSYMIQLYSQQGRAEAKALFIRQ